MRDDKKKNKNKTEEEEEEEQKVTLEEDCDSALMLSMLGCVLRSSRSE